MIDDFLYDFGKLLQLAAIILHLFLVDLPSDLCKIQRNQVGNVKLGTVSFGGCNSDFRTSPGIHDMVRFPRNRTAHNIYDRKNFCAQFFGFPQSCQGIGSFPRLADDNH